MNIERLILHGAGFDIPAVLLTPPRPVGAAVITHGYGGCKEEQLGLGWRVAENGLAACVIDLRGHGQNPMLLDQNVPVDVQAAIEYCRCFGKVVAIGHSLGGRLSLLSNADFKVGISPALSKFYGPQTQQMLKALRSYRVREAYPNVLLDTLAMLPEWQYEQQGNAQIVYGFRDVPEIMAACGELQAKGAPVLEIELALHSDTFLLEPTFAAIATRVREWF